MIHYLLISAGIDTFFILISMEFFFLIIIIDVIIVISYKFYLVYLGHKYRKTLKVSRKDLKYFIKIKKKKGALLTLEILFYSIIITITILILIFSIIGIEPSILIIIICVSIVYILF